MILYIKVKDIYNFIFSISLGANITKQYSIKQQNTTWQITQQWYNTKDCQIDTIKNVTEYILKQHKTPKKQHNTTNI